MIFQVYSIYDACVDAYMQPFFRRAKGEAVREFSEACADDKSPISKYPQSFVLFQIGEFNDCNGMFTLLPAPYSLGNGLEYIRSESNPPLVDSVSGLQALAEAKGG